MWSSWATYEVISRSTGELPLIAYPIIVRKKIPKTKTDAIIAAMI
jgi:hypothetical protein